MTTVYYIDQYGKLRSDVKLDEGIEELREEQYPPDIAARVSDDGKILASWEYICLKIYRININRHHTIRVAASRKGEAEFIVRFLVGTGAL